MSDGRATRGWWPSLALLATSQPHIPAVEDLSCVDKGEIALITRVMNDLVHEEELTDRQREIIAKAQHDYLQAVASADLELTRDLEDTFFHAHKHESTPDKACRWCFVFARDERK